MNRIIQPETVQRTENSIVLSWEKSQDSVSHLQILDDFKEWKTVYRLKYESSSDWNLFKSGTCEGIFYTTRHLLNAMLSRKFGLIRKIIRTRPELVEIENKKLNTPLVQAIVEDDRKLVNLLLHLGAKINRPLMYSRKTPLMFAVLNCSLETVMFLVAKGAPLESVDVNGLTVLHYAVGTGNVEMIEYFVGLGVNVDARDRQGMTPLLRAVILKVGKDIEDILLINGSDPGLCDKNGFDFAKHKLISNEESID